MNLTPIKVSMFWLPFKLSNWIKSLKFHPSKRRQETVPMPKYDYKFKKKNRTTIVFGNWTDAKIRFSVLER